MLSPEVSMLDVGVGDLFTKHNIFPNADVIAHHNPLLAVDTNTAITSRVLLTRCHSTSQSQDDQPDRIVLVAMNMNNVSRVHQLYSDPRVQQIVTTGTLTTRASTRVVPIEK